MTASASRRPAGATRIDVSSMAEAAVSLPATAQETKVMTRTMTSVLAIAMMVIGSGAVALAQRAAGGGRQSRLRVGRLARHLQQVG